MRWINNLYGGAMAEWFDRHDWDYFNYDIYDLLYMGYGDSVPTTQLLGASMTYEKGGSSPIKVRTREQFGATWASIYALAGDKARVLEGLAASYRQAYDEGVRGELEPNAVFAPGSTLEREVPKGKVRHYFLRETEGTDRELREVVGLLQGAGVEVDRLAQPVTVPDYKPYGEPRREVVLPAGTWHVPMAQAQKHWVQAMLGEDSYVPFPYFYDVTAWSLPMLGDVDGGRSGRDLELETTPAPQVGDLPPPTVPGNAPEVGLWKLGPGVAAYESEGWTRWLLERKWGLDYTPVRKPGSSPAGSTASTCCWSRAATRSGRWSCSAREVATSCRTGWPAAAASSAGAAAPRWPAARHHGRPHEAADLGHPRVPDPRDHPPQPAHRGSGQEGLHVLRVRRGDDRASGRPPGPLPGRPEVLRLRIRARCR